MPGKKMDSNAPLSAKKVIWGPYRDRHVKGEFGDIKIYIRAFQKEDSIVLDSLYIILPNGGKKKYLPHEMGAETIEEMKIAVDLLFNLNS
jgi:hypothetical protein